MARRRRHSRGVEGLARPARGVTPFAGRGNKVEPATMPRQAVKARRHQGRTAPPFPSSAIASVPVGEERNSPAASTPGASPRCLDERTRPITRPNPAAVTRARTSAPPLTRPKVTLWPAIPSSRTSCTARAASMRSVPRIFGKLAREITVAAKLGMPDPAMNARLRAAIIAARAENVPKDNIERAIKKASGADAESYDEIRYEGYGPGGGCPHRRGADRQPQPYRLRRALGLHKVRRQLGRDRRGLLHVRPCRRGGV